MYDRMSVISHAWPGYTLLNIWSVTFKDWAYLRTIADDYKREAAKAAR